MSMSPLSPDMPGLLMREDATLMPSSSSSSRLSLTPLPPAGVDDAVDVAAAAASKPGEPAHNAVVFKAVNLPASAASMVYYAEI
jgi:hypothetical protein